MFAKLHSHWSHRSRNVQTCQRSNARFASRMHLRDVSTSFTPNSREIISFTSYASLTSSKSFPVNFFADPHPLNQVPSIFYKNTGGQGTTFLQRSNALPIYPLCFQILAHSSPQRASHNSFHFNHFHTLFIATGGVPPSEHLTPFHLLLITYSQSPIPSVFILLHTLLHFFALTQNSTLLFSSDSALFAQNTRGWGGSSCVK